MRRSDARWQIAGTRGRAAHSTDEPKALPRNRADQPLLLTAVADRLARGVDAARQRRLRNEASRPHRVQQVILADHALSVLNKVSQQIENLRLDCNPLGTVPKLPPVDVQRPIPKEKLHTDLQGGAATGNLKR